MGFCGWASIILLCAGLPVAAQQGAGSPAQNPTRQDRDHPTLSHRPPPAAGPPAGKIKLDVVVTDDAGGPVAGLEQKDFTLLDNKKARPILSFRAVNGITGNGTAADPPVEVVLLVDVANTPLKVVGDERDQIASFLRRNGGSLTQPTSLMIFDDHGVKGLPQPTKDDNRLADELDKAESTMHTFLLTTQTEPVRTTLSLNALQRIIEAENNRSGRTILIWIGDGWPMLENSGYRFTQQEFAAQFDRVVTMSGELREARITLYSIYPTDPEMIDEPHLQHYRSFLKGAPSVGQVRPGDLALPVLAIHSGGRAVDTPADLGDEIARCISEAKSYYALSFDPLPAKRVDEYHELAVHVDKPQMKARTSAGYYAEPTFQFQLPVLGAQH
jgi:VWFA-related protein